MRKTISILTSILLILVTLVHLWCAFMLFIWTNSPGHILLVGLLLAIIAAFVLLFRRMIRKSWNGFDLFLAGFSVMPGMALCMEVIEPHTLHLPWLVSGLAVYSIILGGSFFLRWKDGANVSPRFS